MFQTRVGFHHNCYFCNKSKRGDMTQRLPEVPLFIEPVSDSMNVVAYCVGALQYFSHVEPKDAEKIFSEILTLTRHETEGFDQEKRCFLTSTGRDYWGLQLLCMEYVFNRMVGGETEEKGIIADGYKTAAWLYKRI